MNVKSTLEPGTATAGNRHDLPTGSRARPSVRGKAKERDKDMLRAAATVAVWNWEASTTATERSVEEDAENLRRDVTVICDTSIPRAMLNTGRNRAVYWCTPDIAELRTKCAQARRRYQKARRHDEKKILHGIPSVSRATAYAKRGD
jgi:phosphoenolpyruvate-protein kinase (PTS system EI component)